MLAAAIYPWELTNIKQSNQRLTFAFPAIRMIELNIVLQTKYDAKQETVPDVPEM